LVLIVSAEILELWSPWGHLPKFLLSLFQVCSSGKVAVVVSRIVVAIFIYGRWRNVTEKAHGTNYSSVRL
jgi:hypothetical protein